MEVILEFLLEILIDGAIEIVSQRKVPVWIRAILAVLLTVFYVFLFGILVWIGIKNESFLIVMVTVILAVAILVMVVVKSNEIIKRKKRL